MHRLTILFQSDFLDILLSQVPSSIWGEEGGVMRETNSKNRKKRPNRLFRGCEALKWGRKVETPLPKRHIYGPY